MSKDVERKEEESDTNTNWIGPLYFLTLPKQNKRSHLSLSLYRSTYLSFPSWSKLKQGFRGRRRRIKGNK